MLLQDYPKLFNELRDRLAYNASRPLGRPTGYGATLGSASGSYSGS